MWFDADKIGFNNYENHYRAFWYDKVIWNFVPPDNQIYYISTNGQVVTPYNPENPGQPDMGFGANIVSNTYTNGVGIITFDGPVTRIGRYTFDVSSTGIPYIKDIFIPASVSMIAQFAYGNTSLKVIHIPENVNSINGFCADMINLEYVSVDPNNGIYSVINNSIVNTVTGELVIGTNRSFIDSNITSVGQGAFSGRRNLTTMNLPQGMTTLQSSTFYHCSGLTSVTIPSSVTAIEREAFEGCYNLPSIVIPSGVTSISYFAFVGCSSLVDIRIDAVNPPALPNDDPDVFDTPGSVSGRRIRVPAGSVNVYKTAAGWSDYASEIVSQ